MPSMFPMLTTLIANVLILIAVLVFATGFFPYKSFVPGRAATRDGDRWEHEGVPFDKVIFMVVDALRRSVFLLLAFNSSKVNSDFVYSHDSGFHFVQRYAIILSPPPVTS